jgi:hypothetical protein
MLHTVLIAAHAACGIAAFALGAAALAPRRPHLPGTFPWYLGALWLMVLFLLAAVAVDWMGLDAASRALYAALALLALYMAWRGWHARRAVERGEPGGAWREAYVDDIGFTLIALFDGFVIVGALDLGAPVWLILVVGALGILLGRFAVARTKQRSAPTAAV